LLLYTAEMFVCVDRSVSMGAAYTYLLSQPRGDVLGSYPY